MTVELKVVSFIVILFICKARWLIIRILEQHKPKQIHLYGIRAAGRYRVLRASGTRTKVFRGVARHVAPHKFSRVSIRRFQGVLFVHPHDKCWLTREELRRIRKVQVRRHHRELVSGVLTDSGIGLGLYPVHFNRSKGMDMAMEYHGGFFYSQSWSALAILLSRDDVRRGPAWW